MQKFLVVWFLFIYVFSMAQESFLVGSDEMIALGSAGVSSFEAEVKVVNVTGAELTLDWKVVIHEMPYDWATGWCDPFVCYTVNTLAGTFTLPAQNQETHNFKGSIFPAQTEGEACMELIITDNNSGFEKNVWFKSTTTGTLLPCSDDQITSISEEDETESHFYLQENILMFPKIQMPSDIQIFNLQGRLMDRIAANEQQYKVAHLAKGLYLVQYLNNVQTIYIN